MSSAGEGEAGGAAGTRMAITQPLRRLINKGTGYGLALEGISAADVARSMAA